MRVLKLCKAVQRLLATYSVAVILFGTIPLNVYANDGTAAVSNEPTTDNVIDNHLDPTQIDNGLQEFDIDWQSAEADIAITDDKLDGSIERVDITIKDDATMSKESVVVEATSASLDLENNESILISKFQTGSSKGNLDEAVEIYNNSDVAVSLGNWQLHYLSANHSGNGEPTRTLKVFGTDFVLQPAESITLMHTGSSIVPGPVFEYFATNPGGSGALAGSGGTLRLVDEAGTSVDLVGWGSANTYDGSPAGQDNLNVWQRCERSSYLIDTQNNFSDFLVYENSVFGMNVLCVDPPEPEDVNYCKNVVVSEIGANLEDQFIEVHNEGEKAVSLDGCALATNRSKKNYTFKDLDLSSNEYKAVYVKDTELTLTKTTTGIVYMLASDLTTEIQEVSYSNLKKETSWSNIDDIWKQTYQITPNSANVWLEYPACDEGYFRNSITGYCNKIPIDTPLTPCRDNQYRSEETGRCRNVAQSSSLVPCREGQYRSEETNRCRSIAATVSALKPCQDDEFRNPATNRCKKIASTDDVLVPCDEGEERNPTTNRCRKVLGATTSTLGYPVEKIPDSKKTFAAWWALGGVVALGVLYGAWEYRREVYWVLKNFRNSRVGK